MILVFIGMCFAILMVCLFTRTGQLLMVPATTPEQFLSSMPSFRFTLGGQETVLIQPSSTILVYALGLIMTALGVYFLITRKSQTSRKYWGVGMILWGLSALAAGSSYQAFGYELKCAGFENCRFTSRFELVYMLLTAYSINFLVAATGFTSLGTRGRKRIVWFAIIDSVLYSIFLFVGAIVPIRFLVSYEGFMAFIGLNFVLMFVLNIRHYRLHQDRLNQRLIFIWIGFLLVNVGYFIFQFGGFGNELYQTRGIWFNENDALHVLLILWSLQILLALRKDLLDRV